MLLAPHPHFHSVNPPPLSQWLPEHNDASKCHGHNTNGGFRCVDANQAVGGVYCCKDVNTNYPLPAPVCTSWSGSAPHTQGTCTAHNAAGADNCVSDPWFHQNGYADGQCCYDAVCNNGGAFLIGAGDQRETHVWDPPLPEWDGECCSAIVGWGTNGAKSPSGYSLSVNGGRNGCEHHSSDNLATYWQVCRERCRHALAPRNHTPVAQAKAICAAHGVRLCAATSDGIPEVALCKDGGCGYNLR